MLLRDFWCLDWENRYYVIHAGDHIRLRRVEQEEFERETALWLVHHYRRGVFDGKAVFVPRWTSVSGVCPSNLVITEQLS